MTTHVGGVTDIADRTVPDFLLEACAVDITNEKWPGHFNGIITCCDRSCIESYIRTYV